MSSRRKVIIVGPAFPLRGGIANFNEALCRAMLAAGINTRIISFSLQYPRFLFPGKTQYDIGKGPADMLIETKINAINPFNWIKIAKQIKKESPDYVIVRYWLPFMAPCLGTISKLVKKGTPVKIIAITDNVIPHEKHFADKYLTAYFIKQCNGFVVMSQSVLKDLLEFTATDKKIFLPHPVYEIFGEKVDKAVAKTRLNLIENEKHILFFGFIRKYKGLDLLLLAMADERIKKLGIKLIVAGEYYEDAALYEQIIREYHLTHQVLLKTEFIPSEQVRYYFCAADMVVQPYRTATQSGVTQIAYYFERPMLVTNVGGLPEIVAHNRVGYVTEVNPGAIADAIVDFYENNRAGQFEANTAIEKKRFQWGTFVQGIEDLYRQLQK